MNLEHHRKEARRLVRSFTAGSPEALERAERALGARARARFLLSDAQHVIAVECGYRSWPELKHAVPSTDAEPDPRSESRRSETVIDTGLEYRPGDPVRVRVVRREHRIWVVDDGAAFERAGRPPVWSEAADRVRQELVVNISRHGIISLPLVCGDPGEPEIVRRIGQASLALYQELLEREN